MILCAIHPNGRLIMFFANNSFVEVWGSNDNKFQELKYAWTSQHSQEQPISHVVKHVLYRDSEHPLMDHRTICLKSLFVAPSC